MNNLEYRNVPFLQDLVKEYPESMDKMKWEIDLFTYFLTAENNQDKFLKFNVPSRYVFENILPMLCKIEEIYLSLSKKRTFLFRKILEKKIAVIVPKEHLQYYYGAKQSHLKFGDKIFFEHYKVKKDTIYVVGNMIVEAVSNQEKYLGILRPDEENMSKKGVFNNVFMIERKYEPRRIPRRIRKKYEGTEEKP